VTLNQWKVLPRPMLLMQLLSTMDLGYNIMKGTDYFVIIIKCR
jgi:hypothetical protein